MTLLRTNDVGMRGTAPNVSEYYFIYKIQKVGTDNVV